MKAYIICFLFAVVFFSSCKTKTSCEINNTGEICVTNVSDIELIISVDNVDAFKLAPDETKCTVQAVGTHVIKYRGVSTSHFGSYTDIVVDECKKTERSVDIYE